MKSKRDARLKRARKSRSKIRELLVPRLCVYRSPRHTYAQIISEDGAQVKGRSLDARERTSGWADRQYRRRSEGWCLDRRASKSSWIRKGGL